MFLISTRVLCCNREVIKCFFLKAILKQIVSDIRADNQKSEAAEISHAISECTMTFIGKHHLKSPTFLNTHVQLRNIFASHIFFYDKFNLENQAQCCDTSIRAPTDKASRLGSRRRHLS